MRRCVLAVSVLLVLGSLTPCHAQNDGNAYLRMDTRSDLDLHGYFPWGTHVWYANKAGSPANLRRGEYLTHDANVGGGFVGAEENIYFPCNHPGTYTFRVHNFSDHGAGNNPYVLRVNFAGDIHTHTGNLGGTGSEDSYSYARTAVPGHNTQGSNNNWQQIDTPAQHLTRLPTGRSGWRDQIANHTHRRDQNQSLYNQLRQQQNNPNPYHTGVTSPLGRTQTLTEVLSLGTAGLNALANLRVLESAEGLVSPFRSSIVRDAIGDAEFLGDVADAVKYLNWGVKGANLVLADDREAFGDAFSDAVKEVVKELSGWAAASATVTATTAGGATAGSVAPGAGTVAGGAAGFALGVAKAAVVKFAVSQGVGIAYDWLLADHVGNAGEWVYDVAIKEGSLGGNTVLFVQDATAKLVHNSEYILNAAIRGFRQTWPPWTGGDDRPSM